MSDYDNQLVKYEPIRCDNGACYNLTAIEDLQSRVDIQRIQLSVQGVSLLTANTKLKKYKELITNLFMDAEGNASFKGSQGDLNYFNETMDFIREGE